MFRIDNKEDVQKAFAYVKDNRVNPFFNDSLYQEWWNRYLKRRNAYKCKHDSDAPKWKSKMHFSTFFLGCKALDAQLKKSHRNFPFIYVSLENGKNANQDAKEMAQLAHYDVNHDIYISKFKDALNKMYWYTEICGVAVGREYVISDINETKERKLKSDAYNIEAIKPNITSKIQRKEHTKTEVIHPLNFAHDINKSDFTQSRWGAVRFELPIAELFKMKSQPLAYLDGIDEILNQIKEGKDLSNWSSSPDTFYSDNVNNTMQKNNSIIVTEYSGDFNFSGNYEDNTLYYMLYSKQYDKVLAIGKSPFKRHHYWKMQCYPEPNNPFPVGPCDMLLPLNYWKNTTVNQYNDYMNSTLKFMHEVYPGNIVGGMNSLINGVQGGFVVAQSEESLGKTIKPVSRDKSSMPVVGDIMNMIEKDIQESGPSSNLRGKNSGQLTDTATGIALMAQREDTAMEAILDEIDSAIEDAIQMKLENRKAYMTQEIEATLQESSPAVRYFPFELEGQEYAMYVRRETSDIQSGKYMSYLKLVMGAMNSGVVKPENIAVLIRKVGEAMDIDDSDQIPAYTPPPPMPEQGAPITPPEQQGEPTNVAQAVA